VLYGIYANDGYHKCLIQVCEIIRFETKISKDESCDD
jgi:hypothetical protein